MAIDESGLTGSAAPAAPNWTSASSALAGGLFDANSQRDIVEVAPLPMLDLNQQLLLCHAVASQLVGDQVARYIMLTLQQPPEEALRRSGVAAALHQNLPC